MAASRSSTSAELRCGGACIARRIVTGDPARGSGMAATSELNCSRASCWTLLRRAAAIPSRLRAKSSGISMIRFAICAHSLFLLCRTPRKKPSRLMGSNPDRISIARPPPRGRRRRDRHTPPYPNPGSSPRTRDEALKARPLLPSLGSTRACSKGVSTDRRQKPEAHSRQGSGFAGLEDATYQSQRNQSVVVDRCP
jgi:hypothetical protein